MKISVLGGGISGLVAAYNLSLNPAAHISLYEASPRFGGWLQTRVADNGAKFEVGPHSLRTAGPSGVAMLSLIDEIALSSQVEYVTKDHPAAKVRYLGLEGELVALPHDLRTALRSPHRGVFLKALFRDLLTRGRYSGHDESVHMFFSRRFGREVAELVSDPLCRGIMAADSRTLGVSAMFPWLVAGEYQYRSVLRALYHNKVDDPDFIKDQFAREVMFKGWRMVNFKGGVEQLPRALLNMLRDRTNVDIYPSSPISQISVQSPEVSVTVAGGRERYCDHVVSALPAPRLAACLGRRHGTPLTKVLREIDFVDVAVVSLEFRDVLMGVPPAFGVLLPSYENPGVLGITLDSTIFPGGDTADYSSYRMCVMLGGQWFRQLFGDPHTCDTDVIRATALAAVRQYLKIEAAPSQCYVEVLHQAIPHYTVGHRDRVKGMYRLITNHNLRLSLVGASYNGAGVPDCIANTILHTEPLHAVMNMKYHGYNPVPDAEQGQAET